MNKMCTKEKHRVILFSLLAVFLMPLGTAGSYGQERNESRQQQEQRVTLQMQNQPLSAILDEIQRQTGLGFGFDINIRPDQTGRFSVSVTGATVQDALQAILKDSEYSFRIASRRITIIRKEAPARQANRRAVTGAVYDHNGNPLAGVTVIIKGTTVGTSSDSEGRFSITAADGEVLSFGFIGMQTQEVTLSGQRELRITMEESAAEIGEVVVTGYFERNTNSFTGAAKTISGSEIRNISTTNVINTLAIMDPSIQIVQNNLTGSDPNVVPDIVIRGTTSLNAENELGLNAPLIVIDGVESNLRALYDMSVFDIESVSILKDASATALYGEQAANGVILITRNRSTDKAFRISYNMTGKFEFPDLSGYDLMNAREKLEYEKYAGIYDDTTGDLYQEYAEKLARINAGMDTEWTSKPLRNSFSHNHNVTISGVGSGLTYQVTGRYGSNNGVMKKDNRSNAGLGFYISHNLNNKLVSTLRADYSNNTTKASKYGNFQDYVNANPYDAPYDEDGFIQQVLSYDLPNPLYEATLSSFNKTKNQELSASLNLRWNIRPDFYLTGFGSLVQTETRGDKYVSPLSGVYINELDPTKKGSYTINSATGSAYLLKFTANWFHNLDSHGSMVQLNAGGELRRDKTNPYSFSVMGFFNDKLSDPTFGLGFPAGGKATGESSESATAALVGAGNIIYRNRYFLDASYRLSGSSKFGTERRFAPFWSVGAGWNIHKENFAKDIEWIDIARLRTSYGHTGSINFSPYQAITTYIYQADLVSKYAMGAVPKTMGNPDLKWQTTQEFNAGLVLTLFRGRFDFNFDYYSNRTVDMIVPVSMPLSTGIALTYANIGEQTNKGVEVSLSGVLIKKNDLMWRVTLNAAHNKNKLIKIGETLKRRNEDNASDTTVISPLNMYVEGESTSMLYVVRSAGIDPASGREIYITKDGEMTYTYDPADKVAVGDATPKLRGAMSSFLSYKGFTFNVNTQYSLGGYIYNATRVQRIERIDPKHNTDRRAYAERWNKPGDVVNYLAVRPDANGDVLNVHSQRFIEKENYLNLSFISFGYEFSSKYLNQLGIKRLNASLSMNNIAYFSTVEQERGTNYPFARGFSFSIGVTF